MGKTAERINLEDNIKLSTDLLQEYYLQWFDTKAREYMHHKLRGRIIMEFSNGHISNVYNQEVIAGATAIDFSLKKIDTAL